MSEERNSSTIKQKNLYEVLGIEKSATDDEIKRAYRKLALKYHPDKNRDGDPVKTERFKEVNHAHAILSNPQKRKIYDDYGEIGLKMADQFGEERVTIMLRPWVKWLFCTVAVLTCGCFGCCCCFFCCCQCCCNFCCGKYKPQPDEAYSSAAEGGTGETVITSQPGASDGNEHPYQSSSGNAEVGSENSTADTEAPTVPPIAPTANAQPPNYGATKI